MQLMAIPGLSGQEKQVATFIEKALRKAGVPAAAIKYDTVQNRIPEGGDCGNMILRLPGTIRGPRRMFSAHMDTVPICVGTKPIRDGDRIVAADPDAGLGGDDRAGVAVLLSTVLSLVRRKLPHPPLTFLWTVQEEVGLHGAKNVRLSMLGKPKLAFNWDGGAPSDVTIGATGAYHMTIDVEGLASHAGVHPDDGVSAVAIAGRAIAELDEQGWHGLIAKGRNRGTSNLGTEIGRAHV